MNKSICILFTLFFTSIHGSPFDDLERYFIQNYCFKSNVPYRMSWGCAYYFALKKDTFKRYKVKHPNPKSKAQEELWRDALTAQRMLLLRGQLDYLFLEHGDKKHAYELSSYDDCFNLDDQYGIKSRSLKFPCVKLVAELMREINKGQ